MKRLAFILIAVFCFSGLAMAQDVKQQTQNINIKILQLNAQRDYNNALFLDFAQIFTDRTKQLNEQIQNLVAQRQKLQVPQEQPKAPVTVEPTKED